MTRFLIGQVCSALGVKPHVLRYWERHVDLLNPAKDRSGRRVYSLSDVQLLFRIKYLIYTRGMSVEGASRKIFEEVGGGGPNRKAAIDALRGELLRASLGVQRLEGRLSGSAGSAESAGSAGSTESVGEPRPGAPAPTARSQMNVETLPGPDAVRSRLAVRRRFELDRTLRELDTEPTRTLLSMVRAKLGPASGGEEVPSSTRRARRGEQEAEHRSGGSADTEGARALLSNSPVLVVTPAPEHGHTVQSYPGLLPLLGRRFETVLDRIGTRLAELAQEWGQAPTWVISTRRAVAAAVRDHLAYRRSYGLPDGHIRVAEEPRLPVLAADGRLVIDSTGRIPRYELPFLSALHLMARAFDAWDATAAQPSVGLIVPLTNALPRVPDLEFMGRHLGGEEEVSLKVVRAENGLFPTGEALIRTDVLDALLTRVHLHSRHAVVRRFAVDDDIIEVDALRAVFGPKDVLAVAGRGAVFEVDADTETAFLRSPAEWDSCSERVNAQLK